MTPAERALELLRHSARVSPVLRDAVDEVERHVRMLESANENVVGQFNALDRQLTRAIEERDEAVEWADRLALAIAPESVIGEHSSLNNPWQNALDAAPATGGPT